MRYASERQNETAFLALTGLTVAEFEALAEPFAAQWQQQMRAKTMDGRTRRWRRWPHYCW